MAAANETAANETAANETAVQPFGLDYQLDKFLKETMQLPDKLRKSVKEKIYEEAGKNTTRFFRKLVIGPVNEILEDKDVPLEVKRSVKAATGLFLMYDNSKTLKNIGLSSPFTDLATGPA